MMHKDRRWCVTPVPGPGELAQKLTKESWTLCTGFSLLGYLFLNDSTSENGAQEYAIVTQVERDGPFLLLESITFGWCSFQDALRYIHAAVAGDLDNSEIVTVVRPTIETVEEHKRCPLCS